MEKTYYNWRKTRIIATLGPASETPETVSGLLQNGVNLFRLNCSHGDHPTLATHIDHIRSAATALQRNPAILLDLQGPKIRTGNLGEGIKLHNNSEVVLAAAGENLPEGVIPVSYSRLHEEVHPGNRILLDDGLLELAVTGVKGDKVHCRVINGGLLKSRKGVNLPGAKLSISPITAKDRADIEFAVKNRVDYVALSFVRSANEVHELRGIMKHHGTPRPIIAKIEKGEAVENIDAIIDAADAIMVARGDLGVETAPEEVPHVQKMIVSKCNIVGKPVIIATQMLESMIVNPRPTRAEAGDVANAVYDGADAVMLSGETAAGNFPVEAVSMMDRIVRRTERFAYRAGHFRKNVNYQFLTVPDGICHGIVTMSENLDSRYLVAFTYSGATARLLSKYRSSVPILAMTSNEDCLRELALYWGVEPIRVPEAHDTDEMMETARTTLLERGLVERGDVVIMSTGVPIGRAGTTNMIRVLEFD